MKMGIGLWLWLWLCLGLALGLGLRLGLKVGLDLGQTWLGPGIGLGLFQKLSWGGAQALFVLWGEGVLLTTCPRGGGGCGVTCPGGQGISDP